jgi:anti-sigma B factor antagonist
MFEIGRIDDNTVYLRGRFDASRTEKATTVFDTVQESTVLDFNGLRYISSVGLGILISTQRRLESQGDKLRIINASDHIKDLFKITRFDLLIDID